MTNEVDERFAHITDAEGRKYQVLVIDELGNPVDWDEQLTAQLTAGE